MDENPRPVPALGWPARVVAIGLIAGGLAGMLVLYETMTVCDDQLTDGGNVERVCRHLQATDPPVLAIAVVMLCGLGAFFTKISAFGFTLEREMREIKAEQQRTSRKVENNARKQDITAEKLADIATDTVDFQQQMLAQQAVGLETLEVPAAAPHQDVATLAERYNHLRWTMPSGNARTSQMEQVVREMRDVLRGSSDFDVAAHLGHRDRGVRLAAYAYLNEHEDPEHFRALVHTVVAEDKPFNQYWGLLAVTHQLSATRLDDDLRRELGQLRDRIRRDTDRAQVLDRILG